MMPDTVDLHELANTGGAGQAERILLKAGLMLPPVPGDHQFYRVTVDVTRTQTGSVTFVVAAADMAAAIQVVEDHAPDEIDWTGDWDEKLDEAVSKATPITASTAAVEAAELRRRIVVA